MTDASRITDASQLPEAGQQNDRRARDPVCGMQVRVDLAVEGGLVADLYGRRHYFCREECRASFVADPDRYVAAHGHAVVAGPTGAPVIDEGMRRWYNACACCLSDAYPEIKAVLDEERRAAAQPAAKAGMGEVAEAAEPSGAPS